MILVGAGVWVTFRALTVRGELTEAAQLQSRASAALAKADFGALDAIADDFDRHARAASDAAGDPVWRAAEFVPGVGANLRAVRVVAEELHRVSREVAGPVVGLAARLGDGGLLSDGAVDVELLTSAREPLATARDAMSSARSAVESVAVDGLIPQVADGVSDVQGLLSQLSDTVSGLADLSTTLPRTLGSEEPRTILVMLQNNAELRTGGGIAGSFAEIVATDGRIELRRQADSSDFPRMPADVVKVPASTTALYGDIVGRFVQNATTTPDFDLSARLASEWWEQLTGHRPDTVLSIDPIVLRALLPLVGEVTIDGGEALTHDSFVAQVLVTPYMTLGFDEQTRFFQTLTERFFAGVMKTTASPADWIGALRTPIEQGRISVWSRDEDEQATLAETAFGGPLARHRAAGDGAFAVYFNDVTGAKMDSKLHVALGAATGSCRPDERQEVVVTIDLRNDAPEKAGSRWPLSMTGDGQWGVPAGSIATAVTVAAPAGWFPGGTRLDGKLQASVDVEDGGFPSSATEVTLKPGETAQVSVRFTAPSDDEVEPLLLHTPLLRAPDRAELQRLSCD